MGKRLNFSEADVAEMDRLYRMGFSNAMIAKRYGCLSGSVWARLKKRGTEMRPQSHQRDRLHRHNGGGYFRYGKEYVHRIVAEAWYGPIPEGHHTHHIDGDVTNNHPDNLRIMTESEHHRWHLKDRVVDGDGRFLPKGTSPDDPRTKIRKTHCKRGHPLAGDNLIPMANGVRRCKACSYRAAREWKARKRAETNAAHAAKWREQCG